MKLEPLSREILLQQGSCCGNGCLNCPYVDQQGRAHQKGSVVVAERKVAPAKTVQSLFRRLLNFLGDSG